MNPRASRLLPLHAALAACFALTACAAEEPAVTAADAAEQAAAPVTVEAETAAAPAPEVAKATDAMADASAITSGNGWEYGSTTTDYGEASTARIVGSLDDGAPVSLLFSKDPVTGLTAKVEGLPGPIECPRGCRAGITIDGGAETSVPASRPPADAEQPVLSLRRPIDLWRDLGGASELQLTLPGERTATFHVQGLDISRLPGTE